MRSYYSQRSGKSQSITLSLDQLKQYFLEAFHYFQTEGYFQESFGYECVDAGRISGSTGASFEMELIIALRKDNLWPFSSSVILWSEDDLFDVVEFLYDHISKPTQRRYHDFDNCGWHCSSFDREEGRREFLDRMNRVLGSYDSGFELSEGGEVLVLADTGLDTLLIADIPAATPENVRNPIEAAIRKFRRHRATDADKLDAIRDLAGALEFIRPTVKKFFGKDESDMFNIANNFAIRHNNDKKKDNYNTSIWYSWIFYYYLATLHAVLRMSDDKLPTI